MATTELSLLAVPGKPHFFPATLIVDALHLDGTRMLASSQYNGPGTTGLRVLVPDDPSPYQPRRLLIVLPVKPDDSTEFGDGLDELENANWHNLHNFVLVAPEFHEEPWIADHPTDPSQRYESFVVLDLVPWLRSNVTGVDQDTPIWLFSFSKGGLSALTLIFRHPTVFEYATAWDVPALKASVETQVTLQGGWDQITYGTEANYDDSYDLIPHLAGWAAPFTSGVRIWLSGDTSVYHADTADLSDEMTAEGIQHIFQDGYTRDHEWGSGWLPQAVLGLYQVYISDVKQKPSASSEPSAAALTAGLKLGMLFAEGTGSSTAARGAAGGSISLAAGMIWGSNPGNGESVLEQAAGDGLDLGSAYAGLDVCDKTVVVWFRPDNFDVPRGLVDKDFDSGGSNYGGWVLFTTDTARPRWFVDPTNDAGTSFLDDGALLLVEQSYNMLAVTWDNSAATAKFYLHGRHNSTKIDVTNVEKVTGAAKLLIGAIRDNTLFKYDGGWNQVRVYASILTDDQISYVYANPYEDWIKVAVATDAPATSESLARLLTLPRGASEAPQLADQASRTIVSLRQAADAPAISESLARTLAALRGIADAPATSESLARSLIALRAATDAPQTADQLTRAALAVRTTAEAPAVSELLTRALQLLRSCAETPQTSESPARSLAAQRTASEAPTVSEVVTRASSGARGASETLVVSESLARSVLEARAGSELPAVSESLARLAVLTRVAADSPTLADSVEGTTGLLVTAADDPATSELTSRLFVGSRTTAESPQTADAAGRAVAAPRAAGESPQAADVAARLLTASRAVAESPATSEAADTTSSGGVTAGDSLAISLSLSRTFVGARVTAEAPGLSDDAAGSVGAVSASASDSVDVAGSVALLIGLARTADDAVSLAVVTATETHSTARSANDNVHVIVETSPYVDGIGSIFAGGSEEPQVIRTGDSRTMPIH